MNFVNFLRLCGAVPGIIHRNIILGLGLISASISEAAVLPGGLFLGVAVSEESSLVGVGGDSSVEVGGISAFITISLKHYGLSRDLLYDH